MKQKKIPLRQCVSCKQMKEKSQMIRIVKLANSNEFLLDESGKLNGRGAYICNDQSCIDLAIKRKLINKSFKANVNSEVYENLKGDSIAKQ